MATRATIRLTADIRQYQKKLDIAEKELAKLQAQVNRNSARMKGGFMSMPLGGLNVGMLLKGAGALGGIASASQIAASGLRYAFETAMEFEDALAHMSSLTGATGADLEFFKQAAIDMGATTTQSASGAVRAMQLIGSKMPELLKTRDGLVEVTRAAITLGEAADIDVTEAASALTMALNQMGADASHASEYINVLAKASLEGAGEIPYLTQVIEKVGGTASMVGLSFTDMVAAIEAIAPKVTQAEVAGTGLRAMLIKLEAQANDKFKPSVVGLTGALENLGKANLNTRELTKLVGLETLQVAQALISEREECTRLTGVLGGTNTAYDQARTNTNTLKGAITGLKSAWEGFVLTLNNSNGVLKSTVNILAGLVDGMRKFMTIAQEDKTIRNGRFVNEQTFQKEGKGEYDVNAMFLSRHTPGWNKMTREQQRQVVLKQLREDYRNSPITGRNANERTIEAHARAAAGIAYANSLNRPKTTPKKTTAKTTPKPTVIPETAETLRTTEAPRIRETRGRTERARANSENTDYKASHLEQQITEYKSVLGVLNKEIAHYESRVDNATTQAEKDTANAQIARLTETRKELEKSLNDTQIDALRDKWQKAPAQAAKDAIMQELMQLEDARGAMEQTLEKAETAPLKGTADYYDQEIARLRELYGKTLDAGVKRDLAAKISQLGEARRMLDRELERAEREADYRNTARQMASPRMGQMYVNAMTRRDEAEAAGGQGPDVTTWQNAADAIAGARNELQLYGGQAVAVWEQVKGLAGGIEGFASVLNGEKKGWDAVVTAIDSAIGIYQAVMGIIQLVQTIQAIASATQAATASPEVAASVAKAAAYKAESDAALEAAAATMFLAHAAIPFAGAGIAAGEVAAMMGTMATLKATSMLLASGGVVDGAQFSGDRVLARVNSGEMVINRSQQRRLLELASGGDAGGAGGASETVVTGEQLIKVINNTGRRSGRGRLVFQ